jgi:hypothetical protein
VSEEGQALVKAHRDGAVSRGYRRQMFAGDRGLRRFEVKRTGPGQYRVCETSTDQHSRMSFNFRTVLAPTCDAAMTEYINQWTPF